MNSTIWLITAPDKLVTILSASAWQALTKKNHVLYIMNKIRKKTEKLL